MRTASAALEFDAALKSYQTEMDKAGVESRQLAMKAFFSVLNPIAWAQLPVLVDELGDRIRLSRHERLWKAVHNQDYAYAGVVVAAEELA